MEEYSESTVATAAPIYRRNRPWVVVVPELTDSKPYETRDIYYGSENDPS
ncbi:hypothetical protein AB7C87_13795 [Natrarchaeobius sp. A-rgal3]